MNEEELKYTEEHLWVHIEGSNARFGITDHAQKELEDAERVTERINAALEILPPERLWFDPDCGLKTRGWDEVVPSLRSMVAAAHAVRAVGDADADLRIEVRLHALRGAAEQTRPLPWNTVDHRC